MNRIGNKARLSATENFETVLSSLKMRRGLLKTVLTCRHFCPHHRQDKTVSSCFVHVGGVLGIMVYGVDSVRHIWT